MTSFSFVVREAGAWPRPRRWRRRAIGRVTTSPAASKGRSMRYGTVAPSGVGRQPVFPGCKARTEDLSWDGHDCPRRALLTAQVCEVCAVRNGANENNGAKRKP